MWCPKCEAQYREGLNRCADCGEYLVEELTKELDSTSSVDDSTDRGAPVFLVGVYDNWLKAEQLKDLLEQADMPVSSQ